MLIRAAIIWLGICVMAILNGAAREGLVGPRRGEYKGHVVSTGVLCGIIFLIAWLALPWIGVGTVRDAWIVGGGWLTLTFAFEFLAGHYLFGNSWERLLADYNVRRSRVWPLVLISSLFAPILAHWLRSR
jgi:hypothetical protein